LSISQILVRQLSEPDLAPLITLETSNIVRAEHGRILMQKITPFLWFDNQAEEAAKFYVSIFKNSKIVGVTRYGEAGPGPQGSVMIVTFELGGQGFIALNGGPHFKFTEAISFSVDCKTQEEMSSGEGSQKAGRKDNAAG
jgi:predicted 3-demethylubiquinone-9 3-methyltransferase (glyoxalase superfamily)